MKLNVFIYVMMSQLSRVISQPLIVALERFDGLDFSGKILRGSNIMFNLEYTLELKSDSS